MPDGSTASYPFTYQAVPAEPANYSGDNNGNFITPTGNPTVSLIPGNSGIGPSFYQWSIQGGSYTDTLGNNPALSVSPETIGQDGQVSIFGTVTYPYGSSSTGSVTPHYTNYTIETNFGCSGIAEYQPSTGVLLLDSLKMADGRSYSFTYEAGPGTTSTGRIASITLPSGGTITYAYTRVGLASVNCNTGAPLGFTRTVTDGLGNSYPTTYAWAQAATPLINTTTVTDPTGASVVHSFAAIIGGLGPTSYGQELVETSAVFKDSSGTVLKTVSINYNGGPASSSNPTYPVTSIQTLTSLPSSTGVTAGTNQVFNTLGLPTETDVYDFGTSGTGTYGTTMLSKTLTTYASLGQEYGHPQSVTTYGLGGTTITGETTYGYDQTAVVATSGLTQHTTGYNHGNMTTMKRLVTGTNTWLTSTYTYNDTGTLATATDVNGATTTYNVNGCNGAFPSSSSSPVTAGGVGTVTLTTSQTWNCAESTVATSTDLNGNTASAVYADPYDRPTEMTDALNNQTTYSYPSTGSNRSSSSLVFNSGSSTLSSTTSYDGLGRPILQQQAQGVGSSNYDSVAVSYNSIGLTSYTSMPYTASLGTRTVSGPGTTYLMYDGIARPLFVTDGGGGYTQYAYSGNDTTVTTGPAPTGETVKVRVLETDGSGALTSVCEVNSLGGSGPCGQYVTNTGYLTKYILAAGTTTVQQNAQPMALGGVQTRTVNFDLLGRTTSETIPELGHNGTPGTVTYRYDSDSSGTCPGTYAGDLIYKSDAAGNVTCYAYDNQHRMLSSSVVSGPQASVTAQSRFVYDVGNFDGKPFSNAIGTAVEAYTCASGPSCATKLTDFYANTYPEGSPGSYTGRTVSQVWQWSTNSGGYYTSQSANYPNGARAYVFTAKENTSGYSTATVSISGSERGTSPADVGLVQLTVGGMLVQTPYNSSSTATSVAAGLAGAVNSSGSYLVTATASGTNVFLTSKTSGPNDNYSIVVSSFTTLPPQYFSGTSFPATAPSEMQYGGATAATPQFTYTLDGEGRVNGVRDVTNALNLVTAVTYNASSSATAITYGNGDSDSYTPDPNTGRVTGFTNAVTGTSAFNDTGTLGWNANGSLHSFGWVDGNNAALDQSCTYSSDALNRIAGVTCTSTGSPWGQTFTYDAFGNVKKVGNGGTSYMANYNAQTNQVSSGVTATYDTNGNQTMTNFVSPMTYDANQNPVVAGSASMTYDALGRLVEFGGNAVVYGPDGEKVGVFNGSTYVASFALPGGGEAYYTSGALTSLRRKDWLGSSRLATSWSHAVVSKAAYAPYGENYGGAGTTDLDFTGQTQSSVSTLFDFPARKYDPNAGRWTVPDPGAWGVVDPTNPQSFNRYAYVLNNPLSYIDPSGLDYCDASAVNSTCDGAFGTLQDEEQREANDPHSDGEPRIQATQGDPGNGGIGSVILFQSGNTQVPWDTDDDDDNSVAVFAGLNLLSQESAQIEGPQTFNSFGNSSSNFPGGGANPTDVIRGLYRNILEHLAKIKANPTSQDVGKWKREIDNWTKQILEKASKREGSIDKYLKRIINTSASELQNLLEEPIIIINPCFVNPFAPYCRSSPGPA
jgi:RHS repeat-associated protein